ncbi:MAG TPA: Pycsar system effector family protein [Nitriliruptorales bacterium]|nr:Pycsar system effector family protein [Nitriliruptorales bacterium]
MVDITAYTDQLLDEARGELAHADAKASILLGSYGVAGGVLLAAFIAGDWSPSMLDPSWITIVWWVGILAFAMAIGAAGAAVHPRTEHRSTEVVYFWGHVVALGAGRDRADQRELVEQRLAEAAEDPAARAVDQLVEVSNVIARKYRLVRRSLIAALISIVLTGVTGISQSA